MFAADHLKKLLDGWPNAADFHIRTNKHIRIQTGREVIAYTDAPALSHEQAAGFILALHRSRTSTRSTDVDANDAEDRAFLEELGSIQRVDFPAKGDTFLGEALEAGRLRVHCFWDQNGIACTARLLAEVIPPLDSLGFDEETLRSIRTAVTGKGGIAFVTGQTGNGKSTTLAALAQWYLDNHSKHVVTIEDPIEYVLADVDSKTGDPRPCLVTQQEVGGDVASFAEGVVEVLRKDPDVVILGECRTRATMEAALQCADTGHFVLATLHTRNAAGTLSRIVKLFPEGERDGILMQLGETLRFILSQSLLPGAADTRKKVLAYEFMINDGSTSKSAIVGYAKDPTPLGTWLNNKVNMSWTKSLKRLLEEDKITADVHRSNQTG